MAFNETGLSKSIKSSENNRKRLHVKTLCFTLTFWVIKAQFPVSIHA